MASMLQVVIIAVNVEASVPQFYRITKTTNQDGMTYFYVKGRGISENTPFEADDDMTVYIGNGELVIGKKVFCNKPDHLYLFAGDGSCYDYDYTYGIRKMGRSECDQKKKDRDYAKNYLNKLTFKENYFSTTFILEKKETNSLVSYKIVGNGVVDVIVFSKNEDYNVKIRSGSVLLIGDKVFTDTRDVLYVKTSGGWTKRGYQEGQQYEETVLGSQESASVVKRMKAAVPPVSPPITPTKTPRSGANRFADTVKQAAAAKKNGPSGGYGNPAARPDAYRTSNSGKNYNYNYNYNNNY